MPWGCLRPPSTRTHKVGPNLLHRCSRCAPLADRARNGFIDGEATDAPLDTKNCGVDGCDDGILDLLRKMPRCVVLEQIPDSSRRDVVGCQQVDHPSACRSATRSMCSATLDESVTEYIATNTQRWRRWVSRSKERSGGDRSMMACTTRTGVRASCRGRSVVPYQDPWLCSTVSALHAAWVRQQAERRWHEGGSALLQRRALRTRRTGKIGTHANCGGL